jgi:hypothetical protein
MKLDLTMEEILEDLCYPGPPPGQWRLNSDRNPGERAVDPDLVALLLQVVGDHGGHLNR